MKYFQKASLPIMAVLLLTLSFSFAMATETPSVYGLIKKEVRYINQDEAAAAPSIYGQLGKDVRYIDQDLPSKTLHCSGVYLDNQVLKSINIEKSFTLPTIDPTRNSYTPITDAFFQTNNKRYDVYVYLGTYDNVNYELMVTIVDRYKNVSSSSSVLNAVVSVSSKDNDLNKVGDNDLQFISIACSARLE